MFCYIYWSYHSWSDSRIRCRSAVCGSTQRLWFDLMNPPLPYQHSQSEPRGVSEKCQSLVYSDVMNPVCYSGCLQWSAWGSRHYNSVVLIRNRTIRASVVVVILNVTSWLSSFLCYHGYKPARAQQAPPLWAGLRRQQRGRRTDLRAASFKCSGQYSSPLFSHNCLIDIVHQ